MPRFLTKSVHRRLRLENLLVGTLFGAFLALLFTVEKQVDIPYALSDIISSAQIRSVYLSSLVWSVGPMTLMWWLSLEITIRTWSIPTNVRTLQLVTRIPQWSLWPMFLAYPLVVYLTLLLPGILDDWIFLMVMPLVFPLWVIQIQRIHQLADSPPQGDSHVQ